MNRPRLESWVQDPRSSIWTMVCPSMEEAKSPPREDMKIRGVYSHSSSNRSGGSIPLWGVTVCDVADAVRIEDLQGVKIPHCEGANLDDIIVDWVGFAKEVSGEL